MTELKQSFKYLKKHLTKNKQVINNHQYRKRIKFFVASGLCDDTVKIWDKYTGDLLKTLNDNGGSVNYVVFDGN